MHDGVDREVPSSQQRLCATAPVDVFRVRHRGILNLFEGTTNLRDREEQEHQRFERSLIRARSGRIHHSSGILPLQATPFLRLRRSFLHSYTKHRMPCSHLLLLPHPWCRYVDHNRTLLREI